MLLVHRQASWSLSLEVSLKAATEEVSRSLRASGSSPLPECGGALSSGGRGKPRWSPACPPTLDLASRHCCPHHASPPSVPVLVLGQVPVLESVVRKTRLHRIVRHEPLTRWDDMPTSREKLSWRASCSMSITACHYGVEME